MDDSWLIILTSTISAFAAVASAAAALLVLGIAKRQTDPRILVTIEQIQDGSSFFGLVLRNVGASPSFNVSASVDTQYRPVGEPGVLSDVRDVFSHKWPMLAPGQVVAFKLDRDKVWDERNSKAQLIVEVQYSKQYGMNPKHREKFDVKPSWKDGQLLGGPSIWREIDTRVRPIVDIVRQSERHLANISQALDKDDE
jgi:hypothetical protein